METLNKQIEKSNEFINSIKAELSELKIRPQSYAASLGTIAKGEVFYQSANDNGMGIRVRGILLCFSVQLSKTQTRAVNLLSKELTGKN